MVPDVKMSIEHFFTPILLKIDELDSSTRQFFEGLKNHVRLKGSASIFTQRDIRHALNYSKIRASYFFKKLQDLEYIQVAEGTSNRGYKYQIAHWDDFEQFKIRIKHELLSQLDNSARMPEK